MPRQLLDPLEEKNVCPLSQCKAPAALMGLLGLTLVFEKTQNQGGPRRTPQLRGGSLDTAAESAAISTQLPELFPYVSGYYS